MSDHKELQQKLRERADENKIVRRIVAIVLLIFVILLAGIIIGGSLYVNSALKPVDPDHEKTVKVSIPIGSSSTDIAKQLEKAGVIKSARVFRYYVKYKNESGFQAGDYELTTAMGIDEIIAQLKEGKVLKEAALRITIPEGLRLIEIVDQIAEATSYTSEEILEKMEDEAFINSLIDTYPMIDGEAVKQEGIKHPLEGYLFPATYGFEDKKPTIETIIVKMVKKMQDVVEKYQAEINESPYSVHEILTLASIIEVEAHKSEDRFKVSGVFHNRLEGDMTLGSDPTVNYALDKKGIQVTYKDTEVDSPYNTYRHQGIPIGPIASPREESIKAALEPTETEALYFYARPNGEVIYTNTLSEHNKTAEKYRHEWEELMKKQEEEKS